MNNEEWRNDELLAALDQFREAQTPENEAAFVENLAKAVFIAPVNFTIAPTVTETGELQMDEDSEMRLVTFETEEGHSVFPVFTDMDAFSANEIQSEDDLYSWPMTIADYLPILQNDPEGMIDGLAMNPFSNGMPISRDNLAYIAGMIQTAAQGGEDAEMSIVDVEDSELPTPLLSELIGIADESFGAIEKFYVLWLTNQATGVENYLLVVDGPDADKVRETFPKFAEAFNEKAEAGKENVDMIVMADFGVDMSEFSANYNRNLF